ncbi:transcription regulator LuxR family VCA1078 [Vibrio astriarenae]|nr:transcription regulator LuxR family VCA1078 [Vibrio sp. C7]
MYRTLWKWLQSCSSIEMLDCFPYPIGIKDAQARWVFMNKVCKEVFCVPDDFKYQGLCSDEFIERDESVEKHVFEHDQLVLTKEKIYTSFDAGYIYHGEHNLWIVRKHPIHIKGKLSGLWFFAVPARNIDGHNNAVITHVPPDEGLLTEREWEVLYFVLLHLSRNEIAEKLGFNKYYIRRVVNNIKKKLNVSSQEELMKFCFSKGWNAYTPIKHTNLFKIL